MKKGLGHTGPEKIRIAPQAMLPDPSSVYPKQVY